MKMQALKHNHWLTTLSDVKNGYDCQWKLLEKSYAKGEKKVSNFISKLRIEWEMQGKGREHTIMMVFVEIYASKQVFNSFIYRKRGR